MIGYSKFYRAVRKFAVTTPVWGLAIRYEVKPDEIDDLTLASRRIYGRNEEAITVMAAAGIDRINQSMKAGTILVLPTESQLIQIKTATGFPIPQPKPVR